MGALERAPKLPGFSDGWGGDASWATKFIVEKRRPTFNGD
jgi:hypothetical protein